MEISKKQQWLNDPLFSKDFRDKIEAATIQELGNMEWLDALKATINQASTDPVLRDMLDQAVVFYKLKYGGAK